MSDVTAGTRVVTGRIFRVRDGHGWGFSETPPGPPPEPVRRPARVARMLALAHRLEETIESGEYCDRAHLAKDFGLSRTRITQLLDMTLLAPDIQEEVLELEAIDGLEPVSERALREVLRYEGWDEQQATWRDLKFR